MNDNILAIDIGGSKIIVGIVDNLGNVISQNKTLLPQEYDIDFLIEKICEMSEEFMKYNPKVIGVTIPGLADAKNGIWKYAPFSGISEIPISDILEKRLGLKVYIENDVNACAIGEKEFGICKNDDNFLWMTVSNGIGGALYINRELYTGDSGNAGEIGHFIVEENTDSVCGCGKVGCLEAMASGKGIERAYYNLTDEKISAEKIAELAENGEKSAKKVFEQAGFYIGKAISYCINILNIKKIIIGGGVSQSFCLLEKSMHNALDKFVFKQANKDFEITKTGLGYMAALIGAAATAKQQIERNEQNEYK